MREILKEIQEAVWDHDAKLVQKLTENALDMGLAPSFIVNEGLVAGMKKLGDKFKTGEVFIPEILVSARAMAAGMALLKPLLVQAGIKEKGIFLIGTVKDDLHDIGKNLVIVMLEGAGYRVVDLGVNVPLPRFLAAVEEYRPDMVGMSALLTTTMINMKEVTQAVKNRHPDIKVIVGGAPVTARFAQEIGADAYGADAAAAVEIADRFLTS
jgi:corrinoid protein of di/trimethylamine methyltransferase